MEEVLLSNSKCLSIPFQEQCLAVFPSFSNKLKGSSILRGEIDGVFMWQRNAGGQIYSTNTFDNSEHLTTAVSDRSVFKSMSSPTPDVPIPMLYIPNTSNYVSNDLDTIVINKDTDLPRFEGSVPMENPIAACNNLVRRMFESGLSESFTYDTKKRSSKGKGGSTKRKAVPEARTLNKRKRESNNNGYQARINCDSAKVKVRSKFERNTQHLVTINVKALPTITMGYSNIDANEYAENNSTIGGNIKPFLKNGNVQPAACKILVELIELVFSWLPREKTFDVSQSGDVDFVRKRERWIKRFKNSLCGNSDIKNFRVEGIAILIPSSIGMHVDELNCGRNGMTTVVSVNANVPKNEKTVTDGVNSKLWKWMDLQGYETHFPCSIILYSRRCVGNHISKMIRTRAMKKECHLRYIVFWAITKKVGSNVDYRAKVYNNNNFPSRFKTMATRRTKSRFRGRIYLTVACYDKIVSTCVDDVYEILLILTIIHLFTTGVLLYSD